MNNFVQYSMDQGYFAYYLNSMHPRQKLDLNNVSEDNIVFFPHNIYSKEPMAEPTNSAQPRGGLNNYIVGKGTVTPSTDLLRKVRPAVDLCKGQCSPVTYTTRATHPPISTKYGKLTTFGGLCRFGYCNGPSSGADYGCGSCKTV
jgi:hypothetical protein